MKTQHGRKPRGLGGHAGEGPGPAEVGELAVVVAAVLQGVIVGGWLAAFPGAALRAGGFPEAPYLFVRWAGVLHLVLAAGYSLDWLRLRRVTLLVVAKGATALFLLALCLADGLPQLMYLAISVEAVLACAAAALHGPADRSRRSRAHLRLVSPSPSQIRGSRLQTTGSRKND